MKSRSSTLKTGFCALCRSRCGAQFEVVDGKLVAAHPEPNHPTGVALCTKGRAAPEICANPNRLLYPIRRTAPKGSDDPGWQRISWQEALDEIAHHLTNIRNESGGESVAFGVTTSSGTPISDSNEWIDRFIRVFGSPNTINGTEICNWHKDNMHQLTNGSGIMYPDYVNTDLVFLWGFNPSATWLDQATQIAAARSRGVKIIAVDPRSAGFAGSATQWLKIRPGGDGALALGLLRATIEAHSYDETFLRRWTSASLLICEDTGYFLRGIDIGLKEQADAYIAWNGAIVLYDARSRCFEADVDTVQLRGRIEIKGAKKTIMARPAFDWLIEAVEPYTPQRVEAETDIAPQHFLAAAQLFMEAKTVAYYCWSGIGQHANAAQTDRAIALLMALKGCQDAPGGNVIFTKVPSNGVAGPALSTHDQLIKAIGLSRRPYGPASIGWVRAADIYRAILEHEPYPIRALMSFGSNFAISQSDGNHGIQALRALEFHVHCDVVESPTAKFADIVLPVNTPWEREALRIGFEISQKAESLVQLRQQVVSPAGESRSDIEIVFALAMRMGFREAFFDGDIDRARNWQLAPSGLNVEMLRARPEGIYVPQIQRYRKYSEQVETGYRGFSTETGLIEIYCERLLRANQPPLPIFKKPMEDPDFPLVLTTFKSPYFCHSQYRDIASLRRRHKTPRVIVHPKTAEKLGLLAGEAVKLSTKNGSIIMELALEKHLSDRSVLADYGWGYAHNTLGLPNYDPFSKKSANYNQLISAEDASDPITGSVTHRGIFCAIHALEEVEGGWHGFRKAHIVFAEPIDGNCLRVGLALAQAGILPDYQPGQHIVLSINRSSEPQAIIRCYSLVASAIDPKRQTYVITVRHCLAPISQPHLPSGKMSSILHQGLRPDDQIMIMAPKGRFILPLDSIKPMILIAGGIGITPFLSYLETLAAQKIARQIHLIYVNRNGASHAYAHRLRQLQTKIAGLHVTTFYTQPQASDRLGLDYDKQGYFTLEDVFPPGLAKSEPLIFHCGPAAMMLNVEQMLAQQGVASTQIFSEAFSSHISPSQMVNMAQGPFTITFARSGKKIEWRASSGSVLEIAERAGIALRSGCRAGQCESCRVDLIKGHVRHLEEEADEDEFCLTCCAFPKSDLILDA